MLSSLLWLECCTFPTISTSFAQSQFQDFQGFFQRVNITDTPFHEKQWAWGVLVSKLMYPSSRTGLCLPDERPIKLEKTLEVLQKSLITYFPVICQVSLHKSYSLQWWIWMRMAKKVKRKVTSPRYAAGVDLGNTSFAVKSKKTLSRAPTKQEGGIHPEYISSSSRFRNASRKELNASFRPAFEI